MKIVNLLNITKDILLLLLIGIVIYLLFFEKDNTSISSTSTIVYRDTIIDTNITNNLKPTYVTNTNAVSNLSTDTNLIKDLLNKYFTKNFYIDTVKNDTSMLVIIKDSVYENSIKYTMALTKNNRPTLIQTINNVYYERGLFISGHILTNPIYNIGIGCGYKFNRHSVGLSIYTNKSIGIDYTYDINIKQIKNK